jgi:adenylate cyclase
MTSKVRKTTLQLLAVMAVLFGMVALRVADPTIVGTLRGAGFDSLQRMFPRVQSEPLPVRVVDIDEASLKTLGQWPWSRSILAQMVDGLVDMGAVSISFDIVFPEPDRLSPRRVMQNPNLATALPSNFDVANLPDTDAQFAAALSGRPTVLAFASGQGEMDAKDLKIKSGFAQTGAPADEATPRLGTVIANLPQLEAVAAGLGGITLDISSEQGVARQIPLLWSNGTRLVPALSVEALRVAQGADTLLVNASPDTENDLESLRIGEVEVPVTEDGRFFVHYRPNAQELYVSAADVINPVKREAVAPKIEGHLVLVGTSAVGLLDNRTTALGENVPGVSIHAQALEQMISGRFLTRPNAIEGLEYLGVILGGLAIAVVGLRYRPTVSFLVAAGLGLATLAGAIYAFNSLGFLLDFTFPLIAFTLAYLTSTAWRLVVTDRDGRNMRRMFGHYVAPSVLANIENNPDALKLGGEVRDVTVMFVDIANFTPLSEKLSPEQLVNTVNGLWDACSGAILKEQGTIDKFIGDAIMAFWNAPVEIENHQLRAAKAALEIQSAVRAYNASDAIRTLLQEKSLPPLAVRIGLASGPACVGNMGSADRFDYSVLGDTVNIAARTESSGKRAAHPILIAGELHTATESLALLRAGHAPMKGKSGLEQIHAVVGDDTERNSQDFIDLKKEHDHIAAKLADKPSERGLASIRQLLDEMALRHPKCADYLRAMADRPEDFVKLSPAHG